MMIDIVNTWNREFLHFNILKTVTGYRETKRIQSGELKTDDLNKVSSKDDGKIAEGIQLLITQNWVTRNNDSYCLSEQLTQENLYGSISAILDHKSAGLTDKAGLDLLRNIVADLYLTDHQTALEGIILGAVFHHLSQQKDAVTTRFLNAAKNAQLRRLLEVKGFFHDKNITDEGLEILEIFRKTSKYDLIEEIVPAFLRKSSNSKKEILIGKLLNRIDNSVKEGYFHKNKQADEPGDDSYLPTILFRDLEKRPYGMRRSQASDLPVLSKLEVLCWPSGLEISADKLLNRISRFPDGQWVAVLNGKVIAALYSQRMDDIEALKSADMDMVEDLYQSKGSTVQLLAVNVHPDVQDIQIGGGLLEFVLQRVPLVSGVEKVVGVTRCSSYQKRAPLAYDEYVTLRNENGALFDPVLRYHELHGATIVQPLKDYRVRDKENDGYGVLVSYDIYNRVRKDFALTKDHQVTGIPIGELVEQTIAKLLGDSFEDRYEEDLPLMEIGLDSADLMVLRETLEIALDEKISASFFFENSTAELVINALADKLPGNTSLPESEKEESEELSEYIWKDRDVAIVSYSFKFPGAETPEQLWNLIVNKESAIGDLPEDRFEWPEWIDTSGQHKGIGRGGYIDGIGEFDAPFFRVSPAEAELMDPQQRILLQLCWEVIERANIKPSTVKGSKTGVFIGASGSDYELSMRENSSKETLTGTGTALAILPNRISYFFDLDGPSIQIDTACSSSLVAVHEAVKSINAGECSSAFVGAVNLICHPHKNLSYHHSGMLSEDGICKTFDNSANGYVRGEGAAILWLKPAKQAIADGDVIKGIIKGTSINHGGQAGGLTVPNPVKQRQLVENAFKTANVNIGEVSLMEAHGTGTPLGDPIEIDGLTKAFKSLNEGNLIQESCGIGSIKTNIGHLEAAAGMAGIIKLLLCMEHQQKAPTNNFKELNAKIDLSDSPFYIQTELTDWKPAKVNSNLIAGVSSFGIGGANGHVVLESYSLKKTGEEIPGNRSNLFILSAKNENALRRYVQKYQEYIRNNSDINQEALCLTLQLNREEMDFRLAVVFESLSELNSIFDAYLNGKDQSRLWVANSRKAKNSVSANELDKYLDKRNLSTLAENWVNGAKINWGKIGLKGYRSKLQIPTYPFEKKTYWFSKKESTTVTKGNSESFVELTYESYWETISDNDQNLAWDNAVKLEKPSDEIALIRLHNPPSNSIDNQLVNDLMIALKAIREEQSFRAVILTGDSSVFSDETVDQNYSNRDKNFIYRAISDFEVPVIAAVDGNVSGAGLILALTADFVILSDNSLVAAGSSKQRSNAFSYILSEKLGKQTTTELILFGKTFRGRDLSNRSASFITAENALEEAFKIAQQMTAQSIEALRTSKKALNNEFRHQLFKILSAEVKPHSDFNSANIAVSAPSGNLQAHETFKPLKSVINLPSKAEVIEVVKKVSAELIDISKDELEDTVEFNEIGIDTILGSRLINKINESFRITLNAIEFRQTDTIASFAEIVHSAIKGHGDEVAYNNTDIFSSQLYKVDWVERSSTPLKKQFSKEVVIVINGLESEAISVPFSDNSSIQVIQPADELSCFTQIFESVKAAVNNTEKTFFTVLLENEKLPKFGFVSGIFKTLVHECAHVSGKVVAIDSLSKDSISEILSKESRTSGKEVLYRSSIRFEKIPVPVDTISGSSTSFTKEDVVLITGGAGGLGKLIGDHISSKYGSTVVSCGRRSFSKSGLDIANHYYECDISNENEVESMIVKIQADFGRLDGIIHAAGISDDSLLINKQKEGYVKVLSPKIAGTINLDQATKNLELKSFIVFSSNASITSNIGQTDYSSANTYLDLFAEERNQLAKDNQRFGKTISMSWPLWKDGGMQFGSEVEQHLFDKWGMKPLPTATGLQIFENILAGDHHHYFTVYGDVEKFNQIVTVRPVLTSANNDVKTVISDNAITGFVKQIVSDILKLNLDEIPEYESFGNLGFDSISLKKFSTELLNFCNIEVTPMAFYSYPTIEDLVQYLKTDFSTELQSHLNNGIEVEIVAEDNEVATVNQEMIVSKLKEIVSEILKLSVSDIAEYESFGNLGFDSITLRKFSTALNDQFEIEVTPMVFYSYQDIESLALHLKEEFSAELSNKLITKTSTEKKSTNAGSLFSTIVNTTTHSELTGKTVLTNEPVAIVGISGRFPQSPDLDTFWNNLKEGKDLISEIPKDRWNWQDYYGDSAKDPMKTKVKWGGFIEDIDKFDPFFFNLSPREAEVMDPQHRVALEAVYHALEDAGIKPESLAGSNTGIYMGSYFDDYFSIVNEAGQYQEAQSLAGLSQSMLVNRISYLLDIHGPSEPVDTACSSSLVAIHKAVEQIRKGNSDVVIAGGVSLLLKPYLFLTLTQAGMLSEDGRCKTFDDSANGYARGEGVGVIVLKSLSKAKADGDRIYGLIRGTAQNHGGKANTLTSPNPNAQKELLIEAYENAGVHPAEVSYIEAHGTGTPLGDPIETEGLKSAFNELFKRRSATMPEKPYCALGSVKTNTGHLEAAAGIIGVIKVLLSMRNKTIPGNPQLKQPNQYLKLDNSPFYLQKETTHWSVDRNSSMIAGVSSFGFGGTNAHVVLESYQNEKADFRELSAVKSLFILSAKNTERLISYATQMADYIEKHPELSTKDIAYTLQTGRSEMAERLAVVFENRNELVSALRNYANAGEGNYISGNINSSGSEFGLDGEAGKAFLKRAIDVKEFGSIAKLWIQGTTIEWSELYQNSDKPSIVSLPGYPFARESYWVIEEENKTRNKKVLHPLLHENISDLYGQKFVSTFSGEEQFLRDHVINGSKILPGVSYIEMVREAGKRSIGKEITSIGDITWIEPVIVEDNIEIAVEIMPYEDHMAYRVVSRSGNNSKVHGEGNLYTGNVESFGSINSNEIIKRLNQQISGEEFYNDLSKAGFSYGDSFRGIQKIWYGESEAIARISLSDESEYKLSPGLLDSALHPALLLSDHKGVILPYLIDQLHIVGSLKGEIFSHVRKLADSDVPKGMNGFDVSITDTDGNILVNIRKFIALPGKANSAKVRAYEVKWQAAEMSGKAKNTSKEIVLIADAHQELINSLKSDYADEIVYLKTSDKQDLIIELTNRVKGLSGGNELVSFNLIYENNRRADVSFVSGFFKSMNLEDPRLKGKLIGVETLNATQINEAFAQEKGSTATDVKYSQSIRSEIAIEKVALPISGSNQTYQSNGVYLVTGGAGAIGRSVVKRILTTAGAKVIVTGRNANADFSEFDQKRLVYYTCDVADQSAVNALLQKINTEYGNLKGVIHSAGVIKDDFIINKTADQINAVLAPKIAGTINLDEATRDQPLDFFVLMASLSGFGGNIGQSDYAAANAFMDEFAKQRNLQVNSGKRSGLSISLDWSLWKDGGMKIDASSEKFLEDKWGIVPFPTEEALDAIEQIVGLEKSGQFVVTYGNREFSVDQHQIADFEDDNFNASQIVDENWEDQSKALIRSLLAKELRMKPEKMKPEVPFENYGIDSILINKITNELDAVFGRLPRTLFFEYQTLGEITEYFLDEHADTLKSKFSSSEKVQTVQQDEKREIRLSKSDNFQAKLTPAKDSRDEEIAIIGLSGRYPDAENIEQFWNNLKNGKDCITEIPADRWDVEAMFDPEIGKAGKVHSKWGGFIKDVDKFDPVFFKISPREAEILDPQERLFLQTAWSAVEDGGYTKELLHQDKTKKELGGKVGVFVGVMYEEYQLFGAEQTLLGNPMALWGSPSSIANRVSYFFDFHGPSMAIDTMCSSSITAIHLACESIRSGESNYAIAGGVNVSIHPNKYLMLSNGKFISAKGKCESFGEGGEGYIPGEGVGAVLLKPLSKAKADGDQIYGVIKATSVNHGGKTNGYTVPNPKAQAQVISSTMEKAGIEAKDISYIEAHGTGTSLGDPIEIAGLSKAFNSDTKQFCAIGSVKSNIGHGESAAGISGVTKVLLQMKNKQLVPSLHSKKLNPFIDFENSPFRVQQNLEEWKVAEGQSRIAGLSSFGAGGSNAHIIIEEYVDEVYSNTDISAPALILLSAKNTNRIKEQVDNLATYISENPSINIHSIANTLINGREHMTERLAFTAVDLQELSNKLKAYQSGDKSAIVEDSTKKYVESGDPEKSIEVQKLTSYSNQQLMNLAADWTKGVTVNWSKFYAGENIRKISLPTYPFLKKRFWFDGHKVAKKLTPEVKIAQKTVTPKSPIDKKMDSVILESEKIVVQEQRNETGKVILQSVGAIGSMVRKPNHNHQIPKIQLTPVSGSSIVEKDKISKVNPTIEIIENKVVVPESTSTSFDVNDLLRTSLAKVLYLEASEIDDHEKFIDLGLDSVVGVEWTSLINERLNIKLEATRLYDFPTVSLLASYIESELVKSSGSVGKEHLPQSDRPNFTPERSIAAVSEVLIDLLSQALYLEKSEIDLHEKFIDLGLDSVVGVEWVSAINQQFNTELNATRLYDFPTVATLSAHLEELGIGNDQPIETVNTKQFDEQVAVNFQSETNVDEVINTLRKSLASVLYLEENEIDDYEKFVDLGLDSVVGVEWVSIINQGFGISLEATRLYDYPNLKLLSEFVASLENSAPVQHSSNVIEKQIIDEYQADTSEIASKLTALLAEVLYLDESEIDENEKFIDLGLDSVVGVEWASNINEAFGLKIEATRLYDYPTIKALSAFVAEQSSENISSNGNIGDIPYDTEEEKLRDLLEKVASGRISAADADKILLESLNPN